ncbi:OmpA family protein [Exilibacterium tricleocarpae]|uniref:OmpA family protein n=1 Tax=Exilibacterium tricleocarpae TaxID=2591008 RepID=A0A545TFE8_9GAMM|nr:OmpA family protein [Exilibacterium tricleocarpae]TQV75940.1 OmpA family protein [Exilibacterium tricleocarpae]
MTKKLILTILVVLVSMAASADSDNEWRISPVLGYQQYDSDSNDLDSTGLWGLGLGYRYKESWGTELIYLQGSTEASIDGVSDDADVKNILLEYKYFGLPSNRWTSPHVTFGLARSSYSQAEDDSTAGVVGSGFEFELSDHWFSRVDLRWLRDLNNDRNEALLTFSLSYKVGRAMPKMLALPPNDADKDGVDDNADKCPNTPLGAAVDEYGCEFDSDRDGVVDSKDKCPNTPIGARVYADGCPAKLSRRETISLNVVFDTGSSQLASDFMPELAKVAQFMREYLSVNGVITGHTDSRGSAEYNRGLSQRRAETVRTILLNEFSIDPGRLNAIGYGEDRPIASNETYEGRQKNRRVEAVFEAQITE